MNDMQALRKRLEAFWEFYTTGRYIWGKELEPKTYTTCFRCLYYGGNEDEIYEALKNALHELKKFNRKVYELALEYIHAYVTNDRIKAYITLHQLAHFVKDRRSQEIYRATILIERKKLIDSLKRTKITDDDFEKLFKILESEFEEIDEVTTEKFAELIQQQREVEAYVLLIDFIAKGGEKLWRRLTI